MGLKELYYKLEDGYYDFLDKLDKAGIPVYALIDPIEAQNIPSFPIVVGLLLLLLVGGAFLFTGGFAPGEATLSLSLVDESNNPLANAIVTVKAPGKDAFVVNTNAAGGVDFKVPLKQPVELTAKKDEFDTKTDTFTANNASESYTLTLSKSSKEITKTLKLLKPGTTELITDEITVKFSCSGNTGFTQSKTTSTGRLELTVPADCGTLYAAPLNGFKTENDAIDLSTAETAEVFLDAPTLQGGSITASVLSGDGQALAGIEVSLYNLASTTPVTTTTTASSGTAVFSNVVPGKYYLKTYDPTGGFAELDSQAAGDVKELLPAQTIAFSLRLTRKAVGKIKLVLRDSQSQEAIANASVTLSKGDKTVSTQLSGANGAVEFSVGENVPYEILVDHAEYILFKKSGITPADQPLELRLDRVTSQNASALTVTVSDEAGKPVEDVRLRLKKADGTAIGSEVVTGVNGQGVFTRVEDGTYYVYAYKPGFGEVSSLPSQLNRRQPGSVAITLPIGSGSFEVRVASADGGVVPGASVRAVNMATKESLTEQLADSDGVAKVEVRADRMVYFEISAQGYSSYTTIPMQPVKDTTQTLAVQLEKSISKTEVDLMGLYSGADVVQNALNPGQKYTARLLLKLPPGSAFDEAGIHLRTGTNENNVVESDGLYISNVRAATASITRGQSFTPSDGYSIDSTHLTTGNAKWANIVFPNAAGGIYEAEADVLVRDTVPLGSVLPLNYRGWAKTGSGYIRFPADNVLGSKVSVAGRYDLYANTKTRDFSAGPSTLCDDTFCYTFGMTDLGTGIQTALTDNYPGRIQNDYKFSFTITSQADRLFNGAELHVENAASALSFSDYSVTDVTGLEKKGVLDGSLLSTQVGSIGKDDEVFGNVKVRAKREGTTDLVVSLVSQGQKLFERTIRVNVASATPMDVQVLPKIIVPFINNNLLITVTEKGSDHTISDAMVTIRRDEATIATGKTNSDGVFVYQLTPPGAGSKITILVEKTGYAQTEITLTSTENILQARPSQIKDILTIGTNPEKQYSVFVSNQTQIPLSIDEVKESPAFADLFKFTLADNYVGTELPVNSDANLQLVVGLTPAAARILEPKKVQGSLDITVSNAEFMKRWTVSVPIELRVGFGDEVDDSTCFSVFPQDLDVSTNTGTKSFEFTLRNNCAVNGQPVPLTGVDVKIMEANKSPLGEFFASADTEGGNNKVRLTNQPAKLLTTVAEGAEIPVTLDFNPAEISSGESKPTLVFTAVHNTATGQEKLTQNVRAQVRINDLSQCIEFVGTDKLVVSSNPYNLGYGQYNAYTTYDPYQYAAPDPYRNAYGYSTGLTQPYSGQQSNVPVSSSPYLVNEQGQPINPTTGQIAPGTNQGAQQQQPYNPNYNYYNQPYNSTYNPQYANTPASLRSYPYSDYRAPNYNYDLYGQGAGGQVQGHNSNFSVKNHCASAVTIDFNPEAGIQVNPQRSVSLEPNAEQTVTVQSSYVLGSYSIEARGRLKNSQEASVSLQTINVRVDNEFSRSFNDCIDINPAGTISLQNFIGKPKKFEVVNSCYADGVRVEQTPSAINFSNRDMILSWTMQGERLETKGNGKVTQIVSFELTPNVQQYQNNAPPFPFEGNPIAKLGNLTYFLTAGYYRVNAPAELTVFFYNRMGQRTSKIFNITIQDLFALGEFLERWMSYGDPNATPQSCLNRDVFKLSDNVFRGTENNCIPDDLLAKGGGVYEFDTARDSPVELFNFAKQVPGGEVGGCGRMDRITDITGRFEKNGIVVTILQNTNSIEQNLRTAGQNLFSLGGLLGGEAPQGAHDLILKVDTRSNNGAGGWNGRATKFTETLTATVERAINGKRGTVQIPMNFCVNEGKPVRESLISTDQYACENGESGPAALTKYGFDKLLFDWRWAGEGQDAEGVKASTCGQNEYAKDKDASTKPTGYYYCDAAQLSIVLNKKAAVVKDLLGRMPGASIDSLNLQRYLIKKLTIPNVRLANGTTQDRNFFLGTNDEILEGSLIGSAIDNIKDASDRLHAATQFTKFSDPTQAANMVNAVKDLVAANALLADNLQSLARNVIVEIREDPVEDRKQSLKEAEVTAALKAIGAHDPMNTHYIVGSQKIWLMTLEEYAVFHADAAGSANYAVSSFSKDPDKVGKTLRFLNVLRNTVRFRVGIRDKPDLSAGERRIVLSKGKLADGVSLPEAYKDLDAGLYKLYADNIQFKAYVKEDGIGEDFRKAFVKAYSQADKDYVDWGFTDGENRTLDKVESGLYGVTLQYERDAAKKETITVTLRKDKGLSADYAKNALFALPLDDLVGLDGVALNRAGFGTTYAVGAGAQDKLFFSYGNGASGLEAKAVNGTGGLRQLALEYHNDYESTKNGKVLALAVDAKGQAKAVFSPSDPVPLQLDLEKSDADPFKVAGVLYDLKTHGAKQGTQLISWQADPNQIGGKSGEVAETVEKVGRLCKNQGDNQYNGLIFDDQPKKGKTTLKAVVFVPVRTDDVGPSELALVCYKDAAKLTVLDDGQKLPAAESYKLNEAGGLARLAERYSVKNLLEFVRDGKICLETGAGATPAAAGTASATGLTMYWNKAKFLNQLDTAASGQATGAGKGPANPRQAAAQEVQVTLSDGKMELSSTDVAQGKVKFVVTNNGSMKHSFTIDGLIDVDLSPGQVQEREVTIAGTNAKNAYCKYHKQTMTATLTVS